MSALYGGERHIYLVGGLQEDQYFNRIDRFNIDTQQFTSVGALPFRLAYPCVHFHNDTIYIVSGSISGNVQRDLISFNVKTHAVDVIVKDIIDQSSASCFDGQDNIYILNSKSFIRYSLSNKQITELSQSPKFEIFRTMVWTILNDDNDYLKTRQIFGASLISN
ncbi:hypothetical protein SAMD00019534_054750 [Acytostelium subglobosum LB1]|uniref:hypothetical protein n=1 Tax=Acytostelium subglobosum LB1 TaxID=1410327 RepID=UPI00064484A6|nr:hypothetical protein SAMD00019534_054750 [Acytostelium subglobosum LB1]GAM22300.1 hypothetical protein SAMD00019534_054750 [Acytostelium subglobosum LB1]|eukprot:XP_012754420.1 hypothetical protein SAMD00019534_054750 [Acytostelium subglobosum LB1]